MRVKVPPCYILHQQNPQKVFLQFKSLLMGAKPVLCYSFTTIDTECIIVMEETVLRKQQVIFYSPLTDIVTLWEGKDCMRVLERWMHLQLLSLLRWFEKLNFNQSWKHLHSFGVGLWDPPKTHEVTQCKCGQTPCDKICGLFHFFLMLNFKETNNKMLLWQQCGHWNVTKSKVKKMHASSHNEKWNSVHRKICFLCHSYCETMKTSAVNRDEAEQIFLDKSSPRLSDAKNS